MPAIHYFCTMTLRFLSVIAVLAFSLTCSGKDIPKQLGDVGGVPVYEMGVERLPDLSVPRSAHVLAYVNGELTAIGGHTTGFVPTATAEYYRDGRWQLVETLFPHDFGFGVVLPSQEVLVGGGCAEPFGIGQTFGIECYDPRTHAFSPLPILDRRRARASMARLSDGTLVAAGNWYAEDAIATYSPESGRLTVNSPVHQRAVPLILQSAPDNAVILGTAGVRGDTLDVYVDRLRGEPFEVPLLRAWTDCFIRDAQKMTDFFIGDESVGGYAWLFPASRKEDGQVGLIKVMGEEFSVLETDRPIPMVGLEGEKVYIYLYMLADREQGCIWLVQPVQDAGRCYVTKVGYAEALRGGKAPVTLYRADLPDGLPAPIDLSATLLPGGRIAIVGGRPGLDEYHPSAAAFILHTEPMPRKAAFPWKLLGLICGLLTGALAVYAGWRIARSRRKKTEGRPSAPAPESQDTALPAGMKDSLLAKITDLMETESLWRQKGLKVSDLATRLGTNATYISACLNGQAGKSFPEFVTDYRLRNAQRLMTDRPDMRLSEVADESGFSNEQSFFRTFKARTGLTPQEWKARQ